MTGEYLELKENFTQAPGIDPFANAIVTGVKGGGQEYIMEESGDWVPAAAGSEENLAIKGIKEGTQGSNIVKTTRIDQSFA